MSKKEIIVFDVLNTRRAALEELEKNWKKTLAGANKIRRWGVIEKEFVAAGEKMLLLEDTMSKCSLLLTQEQAGNVLDYDKMSEGKKWEAADTIDILLSLNDMAEELSRLTRNAVILSHAGRDPHMLDEQIAHSLSYLLYKATQKMQVAVDKETFEALHVE